MDHLGAGVSLLTLTRQRNGIELADAAVALQDHTRIFPGDRRTGLHLSPRNLGVGVGPPSLGDEVVDTADAVLVTGVPVLHRGVLDLGTILGDQLDDRCMQLVLVALRRRASFEVGHMGIIFGNDQRALELARVHRVDTEICGQLHRAANTLRDVAERPVREHC